MSRKGAVIDPRREACMQRPITDERHVVGRSSATYKEMMAVAPAHQHAHRSKDTAATPQQGSAKWEPSTCHMLDYGGCFSWPTRHGIECGPLSPALSIRQHREAPRAEHQG